MPCLKNNSAVSVSRDFILNKLPAANATYVKIYLYMLAFCGSTFEYADIAKALSVLESDVIGAVNYWAEAGVLHLDGDMISFGLSIEDNAQVIKASLPEVRTPTNVSKEDYSENEVSDAVIANQSLQDMMAVAEELLQKPLNRSEMETLYWFYDGLGFSPEAVLLLLEYCISRGKPRLSYAEKVALSWCERGLTTPEDISRYMRQAERKNEDVKFITDKMGISGRALSQSEEQYFAKWLDEYQMSREMILLAFEYCIDRTGKLAFAYMDKILESWHGANIFTPSAAKEEQEAHKNSAKSDKKGAGYEYKGLEQLMRGK